MLIWSWLQDISQDCRFAARMLAKDRRFTLAAVMALGLGIGVNNAVFTLIDAALLRDLPFDQADRLVALGTRDAGGSDGGVSIPDYRDWRDATTSFEDIAAIGDHGPMNVSETSRTPERLRGWYVSTNAFRVLRMSPVLGRDFLPEDDQPGAPSVIMLGHAVWQSRYGGDPSVIGRSLRVNDVPSRIIGVMPVAFTWPIIAEAWQPLSQSLALANPRRDARSLNVFGRVRASVDQSQARADLETIGARLARDYRDTNKDVVPIVKPMKDLSFARPMLMTMMGAVAFVLLVACANLANLLLARSAYRSREIAIRASLGATRWRIVRQLLIECVLLAALAGVLGLVMSIYGAREIAVGFDVIEPGAPPGTTRPYWLDLTMNGSIYAFVGLLCLAASVAIGLIPAWHLSRANVHDALKEGGRSGAGGLRTRRWTSALMSAEMALTLILLTGAALLWRSFVTRYHADLVIDTSNVVTMRLQLPQQKYRAPEDRKRFFERLDERLAAIPVFESVTMATHVPLDFGGPARELSIEGVSLAPGEKPPAVSYVVTGTRYFDTVKLPVIRGRGFTGRDAMRGQEGAIVDQRFAARFFPGRDPLGQRIRLAIPSPPVQPQQAATRESETWLTIVGVASTIPSFGPPQFARPVVYVPLRAEAAPERTAAVIVRVRPSTRGESRRSLTAGQGNDGTALNLQVRGRAGSSDAVVAAASVLRDEVRALDADLPLYAIETLDTAVARSRMSVRLVGTWFGVIALIALVVASVGLYALTAHGVAQRTQEIGVRMALGAGRQQVMWLFLRRLVVPLGVGLALGLAGALSVGRLLHTYLGQVSPRDPMTLALVTTVLVVVAAAASVLPARRAARVEPMVALRAE